MSRAGFLITAFGLLAPIGCSGNPDLPDVMEAKLSIELHTETPVISSGKNPRLVAHLVNDGAESVTIVLPGDGSESGMRTPIVRWNPPMREGRRCGNINALTADEVVTLRPGQRIRLKGWTCGPTLSEPGTHKVSLELENIPDLEWKGLPVGQHSKATMEKVRRTPRFKAVSNVVEVEVQ